MTTPIRFTLYDDHGNGVEPVADGAVFRDHTVLEHRGEGTARNGLEVYQSVDDVLETHGDARVEWVDDIFEQ